MVQVIEASKRIHESRDTWADTLKRPRQTRIRKIAKAETILFRCKRAEECTLERNRNHTMSWTGGLLCEPLGKLILDAFIKSGPKLNKTSWGRGPPCVKSGSVFV